MFNHRCLITALSSLSLLSSALAQAPQPAAEPKPDLKPEISLFTEVFELSPELAQEFAKKFREAAPQQHGALLAELKQLSATKEDPLHRRSYSLSAVSVPDGQRATIEAIREFRYPTEYDYKDGCAMPKAFETRNIGTTFEYAPFREADGRTWAVDTVFQLVHLADVKIYGQGLMAIEQPHFATRKIQAHVTLQPGVSKFVGIVGPDLMVDAQSKEPFRVVVLTAVEVEAAPKRK